MVYTWLLLLYKLPSEPTSRRVYIWRKLKRFGAILLDNAAWVLPDTAFTCEQFQWLAAEISEIGGEAWLWESRLKVAGQEEALVQQFVEQVEAAYRAILSDMQDEECDLAALSQRYQQTKMEDYFHSELGKAVREALISAREGKGI